MKRITYNYITLGKGTKDVVFVHRCCDCFNLMHYFDYVDLLFVRREGNSAVDFMARNASSLSNMVWLEKGHPGLVPFLNVDVMTSKPI